MASNFHLWEKDPFFSAAEEVQESADRMESSYRAWIRRRKEAAEIVSELRRDVQTALGTTKWQLEVFERAVLSTRSDCSAENAKTRHRQFIVAIESQISAIESSLRESIVGEGKPALSWVRLDEGERDELALFLTAGTRGSFQLVENENPETSQQKIDFRQSKETPSCLKGQGENLLVDRNSNHSVELGGQEAREERHGAVTDERMGGHRRTVSANADIGSWKIAVADEELQQSSFHGQPKLPPKVHSFSNLFKTVESTSKLKWPRNNFKKWKGWEHHQADDEPLNHLPVKGSNQLSQGLKACYERSKGCLGSCSEEPDLSYSKHLYGWLGATQRQLQRSQYQIQHCRPVQVIIWLMLAVCLISFPLQLPVKKGKNVQRRIMALRGDRLQKAVLSNEALRVLVELRAA